MAEDEVRYGDIGTRFEFQVIEDEEAVDISSATSVEIIFKKPDRTTTTVDAEFIDDGSDGWIVYVVEEQEEGYFLDQTGKWEAQAKVTMETGVWRSDIHWFWVHRNLD